MPFFRHFALRTGWSAVVTALTLLATVAQSQVITPPAIHSQIGQYQGAMTCLDCHASWGEYGTGVELQFMATTHWTWVHTNSVAGKTQVLGKRNLVNNYCISLASNEPRCTSCHAGVGWRDNAFDFQNASAIDCLVCHDTTGTYKKSPAGAGVPDPTVDLLKVARNAGRTSRATCGACHFYGGGADAVKHGDLDSTMKNPVRTTDVHMGTDGLNQSCTFCHASKAPGATAHDLVGSRYSKPAPDNWLCETCHDGNHRHSATATRARLEAHVTRVACQSCHIPQFARGGKATKMTWDWSTAGRKNPDGSEIVINDANGNPLYDTKKGSFTWEANVTPEYRWFNGDVVFTTIDDVLDPSQRVTFNKLQGNLADPKARIMPVKRFTGRQPYDLIYKTLVMPHLFATNSTDTAAFWKGYNWTNAVTAGMSYVGHPFSGELGWVDTDMFWIENHMVAPKEQAVRCAGCHTPESRLDFLALGYAPDRAAVLQNMAGFKVQMSFSSSALEIRWTGTPGNTYQVQYASDPSNTATWLNAPNGSQTCGTSVTPMSWSHAVPGVTPTYYRVVRSGS